MEIKEIIHTLDTFKTELQCMRQGANQHCDECGMRDDAKQLDDWYCQAVEALKAMEPHVMTWDEVNREVTCPPPVVWLETIAADGGKPGLNGGIWTGDFYEMDDGSILEPDDMRSHETVPLYNVKWRRWSACPTEEAREEAPWDGEKARKVCEDPQNTIEKVSQELTEKEDS